MRGRVRYALSAAGGSVVCLVLVALLDAAGGGLRSILVVPIALAFFWGLAVVLGGIVGVVFGDQPDDWTRLGMLSVAISAATLSAALMLVAKDAVACQAMASAGFWVALVGLLGATFGELPAIGMAEGD